MKFAPTHIRYFSDGTPASVLSVQPPEREVQEYMSRGYDLVPVWDHGKYIDCVPLDGQEGGPYGHIWVAPDGGVA